MLTFNNDPKIKEHYVNRVRMHQAADEIVQGTTWENGKGCAVGCTLHQYSHAAFISVTITAKQCGK